jgi:hypothetical protein
MASRFSQVTSGQIVVYSTLTGKIWSEDSVFVDLPLSGLYPTHIGKGELWSEDSVFVDLPLGGLYPEHIDTGEL